MRTTFCLILCAIVLLPGSALAQRRCDGGGKLAGYLAGTTDGPSPSSIAEVWAKGAVSGDADPAAVVALREAIEVFERQRPSAERAAEIAAGDWTGWRARLMPRDEFVDGFLEEVARRVGPHGEYAAILQAAQAMRNRLDDMHGAAGLRQRPEDPSAMWLWDQHMRQPGATEALDRLRSLPDGKWLWNRYLMGRRTAIACALDEMSVLTRLAATVDRSLFRKPGVVATLVAGRKVPLDLGTMAYLYGLLERRLPSCTWTGSADGLASVMRFQQAATHIAFTPTGGLSDLIENAVTRGVDFAENADDGRADAEALQAEYGCASPVAVAFSQGLVRTVQVDASVSTDSLFVQSCSQQGLDLQQCACLAELGRGVAPEIEETGYDRRNTIKWIVERNPMLGVPIAVVCGISEY